MDKKHIFFIVITALVVIATWVFAPAAVNWLVGKNWVSNPTAAGQLGDLFGSVNALFSGLALIGVVFAIMLQQKELSLSTKELRNSATALSKQVELSADTAQLQALPILIQLQKTRIATCGAPFFENFEKSEHSEQLLRTRLDQMRTGIAQETDKIKYLEQQRETARKNAEIEGLYGFDSSRTFSDQISVLKAKNLAYRQVIPEMEQLLGYMQELTKVYQKISSTKFDNAIV